MAEVRWTLQAADDLEAIADFIASDSPHYASLFVMDVLASVNRLNSYPKVGRVVPELEDPVIRELILGSYRIIYRVKVDLVEILTVYHAARLINPDRLQ